MELFLVVLLLFGSSFFAGSELAVTMSHRARLRTWTGGASLAGRAALLLARKPERAIALCLVGNNLANVGVAVFGRQLLLQTWSLGEVAADALAMVIFVPLVLVLGEVVPKALTQRNPDLVLLWVALPLLGVAVLLWPLVLVGILVAQAVRLLARLQSRPLAFASRDELKNVLAHSVSGGHVAVGERDLIHRIVEFWKLDLQPLVRPLQEIDALPESSSMLEVKRHMRLHHLSRLAILSNTGEDVVGVLAATRLLSATVDAPIQRYLQAPVRVDVGAPLAQLMAELQRSPSQIAVVHGPESALGVVLLDDLLDRLLEEDSAPA
jgi:putative hemolysin